MWKKVLLGIVVFIVVIVGAVFYLTSGMTESAEAFFNQVKTKNYDQAYAMLSEDFRKATPENQMIAFLKQTGLDSYKSASWGNRSFEGKRGVLEGSITTESGGSIPLTIKMVKAEDGKWQIYHIGKPDAGIQTENSNANTEKAATSESARPQMATESKPEITQAAKPSSNIPSNQECIALAKDTVHHFAVSVNNNDMTDLYQSTSKLFQKSVTLDRLTQAFDQFVKMNIDFTVLDNMTPVLDPKPRIDENGVLYIKGYFNTTPNKFYFDLEYMPEDGKWKLATIDINIK